MFDFITISNDEDFNSKCTSITLAFCVINSSHICCSVVKVKQEPTDEKPRSDSVTTNTSSKIIKSCNNSVLLANEQKKRKSDTFMEENVDSRQTISSKKQISSSKKAKLSNVVCHPKNQTWTVEVSKR